MPARRGGHADADSVKKELQEIREQLQRLQGSGGGNRAGGFAGAAERTSGDEFVRGARGRSTANACPPSGGSKTRAAGVERQSRPGDWRCACGFAPNFAHRTRCFACNKQRPAGAGGGGGGRSSGQAGGPLGANGLRPLLAWDKSRLGPPPAGDASPTHRVPGSSAAARKGAEIAAARAVEEAGKAAAARSSATGSSKGAVEMDADGFTLVQKSRKGKKLNGGGQVAGDRGDDDCADGGNSAAVPAGGGHERVGKTAATATDGDATTVQAGAASDAACDPADGDEEDDGHEESDPSELRKLWEREVAVVKALGKQLPAGHPAMVAACAARDAAEKTWRAAKEPAPLAIRLSRAQAKLDRALEQQGEVLEAKCKLEQDFKEKMAAIFDRLEEHRCRISARRRQLEDIQEEAGALAPSGIKRGGGDAIRRACGTLRDVAPVISLLAGQVDANSPAWQALHGVLGSLQTSQRLLEDAVGAKTAAASYDIGDGDRSEAAWSESHDLRMEGAAATHENSADGGAGGAAPQGGADADQDMGSGCWWEGDPWKAKHHHWTEDGYGKWRRQSWADAWETEHQQQPPQQQQQPTRHQAQPQREYDGDEDSGAPSAKYRRQEGHVQPAPPTPTPAELAAAAASNACAEAARATAEARRAHAERVAMVVARAIDMGVQPLTQDGEELHMLDADQLAAWTAENLQESG